MGVNAWWAAGVGLGRLSRPIAGANPCNLCRLDILFAMVRPFLMRRGMVSMPPFLLLASQALLVGGPADFAELESMQSQRSQLLLQTLTRSYAWDFNSDNGLLVDFPRRLWCFPIGVCEGALARGARPEVSRSSEWPEAHPLCHGSRSAMIELAMLKYLAVITISELNNSQRCAASLLWALITPARIYADGWF